MATISNLSKIEKKIKIKFKDKSLLQQVFVHRSYLNENSNFGLDHNERLEFLGDAVLELITTEFLYKNYQNPEGELTNWRSALVKGSMISKVASDLEINDYLLLSKGEKQSVGKARQLILANAFEALIGAIYLDRGYKTTQNFIKTNLLTYLPEILKNESYKDAKSKFQELIQDNNGVTPIYKLISESGPDHAKNFVIGVYVNGKSFGKGIGSSKQDAEQNAARDALTNLEK